MCPSPQPGVPIKLLEDFSDKWQPREKRCRLQTMSELLLRIKQLESQHKATLTEAK